MLACQKLGNFPADAQEVRVRAVMVVDDQPTQTLAVAEQKAARLQMGAMHQFSMVETSKQDQSSEFDVFCTIRKCTGEGTRAR